MLFVLRDKLVPLLIFLQSVICGCARDADRGDFERVSQAYTIKQVGRMERDKVVESSGLALANAEGDLWTHGDGGNTSNLYLITPQGDLLRTQPVRGAHNVDWEDLAQDRQRGFLYIGDFGNNANKRRDLRIYRLSGPQFTQVDTILFRYPDQQQFPPKKARRNFDCEAFFFRDDSLYLFTKNRGKGNWVKEYHLPAKPGNYVARLADSIRINTWITAADISPNGRTVALLGYGHVYLIEPQPGQKLFSGAKSCLPLPTSGQAEALTFVNDHDFVISNEKGKLYRAVHDGK
ncbi:hypothetical protein F0P96_06650 [Hymenobacter busanensis]|uniref:Uncharacterized protein n=1 Tax=Hymenobacter busanensis TaxID=2607656 RepID=A0A7L5A1V2_9BACT|nr:hypothetical protein [Hymenobacter busanensis]KAA9338506.1 hypothetical protein F0P96_06650 [Hymenobacter busanensis]QHJ09066.1 hypothetical protein GUY19_17950 [Hymenobacter busanensis]